MKRNIQIYIQKYPGHYDAHYRQVEADVIGNFAVHPTSGMGDEYTLTHVPSGCAIACSLYTQGSGKRSRTELLSLARQLNRCGIDWFFSLEDTLSKDKEVLEKLRQAKSIVDSFYKGISELSA